MVMNESILKLHLGRWNIESLTKYKSSVELADFVKGFDIFVFCEMWGQNVSQFDTFADGFHAFSVVRYWKVRPSGWVTVFVKYNLIEKGLVKLILNTCNMEECIVLSLDGNLLGTPKELIICFLYISRGIYHLYSINWL